MVFGGPQRYVNCDGYRYCRYSFMETPCQKLILQTISICRNFKDETCLRNGLSKRQKSDAW